MTESKLSFGASYDNETVCPIIAVLKVPKIFFPPFENDANFDLLAPPEASKGYEEAMEGDADDDESDVNEVDIDEDAEDRVAILEASRHKREKLQLILIHMANVSLGQAVFTPDGKGTELIWNQINVNVFSRANIRRQWGLIGNAYYWLFNVQGQGESGPKTKL